MTPRDVPSCRPPAVVPVAAETGGAVDHGAELKRGMFFNTIALLASNFRGVFTFLVARLFGRGRPRHSSSWRGRRLIVLSKIAMFGLDNTIIAFIARAEAAGERARSRALFHLAVVLALGQSTVVAAISILRSPFRGR